MSDRGRTATRFQIDRRAVRRSFSRASAQYAAAAHRQAEVNAELLERLRFFPVRPRAILDLGCGTGQGAAALRARFSSAQVVGIDLAFGMVQNARRQQRFWRRYPCVCGDGNALPFRAQSFDLVFSSLMLQWCDDLPGVFAQIQHVLRPGGLLLFSTFGPETLQELRAAWAQADTESHISAFADMPQLGTALSRAGLAEPVLDRELLHSRYPDVQSLMQELRTIGARHAAADRRRSLMGRSRLGAMLAAYESLRGGAGLPATWEIIYGAAFAGEAHPIGRASAGVPGETRVPVQAVVRRGPRRDAS